MLREWLVRYLQHKDTFARRLVRVDEQQERTVFTYKDAVVHGYAWDTLHLPLPAGDVIIATLQRKENIDFLLKHWDAFAAQPTLTVAFVNPRLNEKWLVRPATHHGIAGGNPAQGIMSIASAVPYV